MLGVSPKIDNACAPYSLRENMFVLKTENQNNIIYAPIQGMAFFCDEHDADEIKDYISDGTIIKTPELRQYIQHIEESAKDVVLGESPLDKPDKLMFILSQQCNLSCSYCFSQESRSSDLLDIEKIKIAINYFLSYDTSKRKDFTFIGGGEPFVTWELLKQTILYIEEKTNRLNTPYQIRIITNGTLLTEKRIGWLEGKKVAISISYDVLKDIQDKQRPFSSSEKSSFDVVNKSICLLRKYNIPFTFRSTITAINVHRMLEMAEFIIQNYPEINKIHFEPVTENNSDNRKFFDEFICQYFKTLPVCESCGVFLTNSYIASFDLIKTHNCSGEFCIVPDGSIMACHRHSSILDRYYDSFKFGFVTNEDLFIDKVSLNTFESLRNVRFDKCKHCFAKWHCAGGCLSKRLVYSPNNNIIHCEFIRSFLMNYIEYQLIKQLK